jgi:hypothetical protein
VETNSRKKKDVQKFIKKELATILINVNPKMDKKDFKKSIKKAGKVLYRVATKTKISKHPIEALTATY